MRKIYTAITSNLIRDILASLAKEVVEVSAVDEIQSVLKQPFDLLVTPVELFNYTSYKFASHHGNIMVLDPLAAIEFNQIKNISIVKTESELSNKILYLAGSTVSDSINDNKEQQSTQVNQVDGQISENQLNQKNIKQPPCVSRKGLSSPLNKGIESQADNSNTVPSNKFTGENVVEDEPNNYPPLIIYDDYPKDEKPAKITWASEGLLDFQKKSMFKKDRFPNNKTIAVWSPLPITGVTTFIVNFAIYLSQHKIETAVIEGMNNKDLEKIILQYKPKPENYKSFREIKDLFDNTLEEIDPNYWNYRGTIWLPITDNDYTFVWDREFIETYFRFFGYVDVVLVDLPSGKMNPETLMELRNVDELWIIVDGRSKNLENKNYIHQILQEYGLSGQLIYNKHFPFQNAKKLEQTLEIPLLTTIPHLTEETARYEDTNKPLIDYSEVLEKVQIPFNILAKQHLNLSLTKESLLSKCMKKIIYGRG